METLQKCVERMKERINKYDLKKGTLESYQENLIDDSYFSELER